MRSLLNRFLMRVEFSLQHSQFSMLFTKKLGAAESLSKLDQGKREKKPRARGQYHADFTVDPTALKAL